MFADLGWWTPLYMFAAGILAGFLWSRFRAGTPFGIVFYPWMAFWILFWFGWNLLFDARCGGLVETAVLLFIYDKINLRPVREASRTRRLSGVRLGADKAGRLCASRRTPLRCQEPSAAWRD